MTEKRIPDEMLARVEPEWRDELVKFCDTGDARQEFFAHLDDCVPCRGVLGTIYNRDLESLQAVAAMIQEGCEETKRKREEELKKCGFWKRL